MAAFRSANLVAKLILSPVVVHHFTHRHSFSLITVTAMTDRFEIDLNIKPGEDLLDEEMAGN